MLNSTENLVELYGKEVQVDQISPEMIRIMKEIGSSREKLKSVLITLFSFTKEFLN